MKRHVIEKPVKVATVNRRVRLEKLADGTVLIVAGVSTRVSEPVDIIALLDAVIRLRETE